MCSPVMCPMTSPIMAPIPSATMPPMGTSSCRQAKVLNTYSGQYEWREVCR